MEEQVKAIFRATQALEARLHQQVSVSDMAEAAGYSLFYFIRTFNLVVQHTPYDYLIRRRLSEAAKAITGSQRRIADIAQDYGFSNQENFSRVFKKMFACSPAQCRKTSMLKDWQLFPAKTMEDLEFSFYCSSRPEIMERTEDTALYGLMVKQNTGHSGELFDADLINRVWESTASPGEIYLASLDPGGDGCEGFLFAGVASEQEGCGSSFLVNWNLPRGKYLRFVAAVDQAAAAWRYMTATWIPKEGTMVDHRMSVCVQQSTDACEKPVCVWMFPISE
jgi:AraC family transcriptional regulator